MLKFENTEQDFSKNRRTVEQLYHFGCAQCGKWWTIGDAPVSKKKWYCPWCGTENTCKKNYDR